MDKAMMITHIWRLYAMFGPRPVVPYCFTKYIIHVWRTSKLLCLAMLKHKNTHLENIEMKKTSNPLFYSTNKQIPRLKSTLFVDTVNNNA